MYVYYIRVKATVEGFDIDIREEECCIVNDVVIWHDDFHHYKCSRMKLDTINRSMLFAYEPQLTLVTKFAYKIEDHVANMKDLIRDYLYSRVSYMDRLLDVCV